MSRDVEERIRRRSILSLGRTWPFFRQQPKVKKKAVAGEETEGGLQTAKIGGGVGERRTTMRMSIKDGSKSGRPPTVT